MAAPPKLSRFRVWQQTRSTAWFFTTRRMLLFRPRDLLHRQWQNSGQRMGRRYQHIGRGVDYVNFTPALSDGSGNLVITYTGNGGLQGDIDGFQLQGPSNLEAARTNDTATYAWTTLAGHPPNGSADGTADTVEFEQPEGVAVDGAGNVYVADSGNNTIRRITQGQVSSTIAGIAGNFAAPTTARGRRAVLIFRRRWRRTARATSTVTQCTTYDIREMS